MRVFLTLSLTLALSQNWERGQAVFYNILALFFDNNSSALKWRGKNFFLKPKN